VKLPEGKFEYPPALPKAMVVPSFSLV